ncbi:hypothetical protein C8034_v007911 [Colletotrichum sidae]|uniref:Uncharacterized protein n=1 Tax=Colletotrichum sidae TaxID=1347389 RepID=A0A4R8TMS2_9PEZI|nr:hypothetical protein C8034_v007911 [Colletotrichum sidae]
MERRASHEDDRPDSVGSAGSRANKKRAASIDVEEANSSSRQQRDYSSETGPMGGEGSKDYICLCTPALKVPRPRNDSF